MAIGRLAERCRRVGRDPGEVEIVYRTHQYRLEDGPNVSSDRLPFTGSAEQVAGDVHRYEEMGVRTLTMDFARLSSNIDEMLHHIEEFATRVRPVGVKNRLRVGSCRDEWAAMCARASSLRLGTLSR